MHTGKMYKAGRQDAFKECFTLITNIANDKENIKRFVGSDGSPEDYVKLDTIRAYGFTLLTLSGDSRMVKKIEEFEKSLKSIEEQKDAKKE